MHDTIAIKNLMIEALRVHKIEDVVVTEATNREGEDVVEVKIIYPDGEALAGADLLRAVVSLFNFLKVDNAEVQVVPSFISLRAISTFPFSIALVRG